MFNLFAGKKGKPGLVGFSATDDRLCLAHIQQRSGKPVLSRCDVLSATTDREREQALEELVREQKLEDTAVSYVLAPTDYKLFLVEAPRVEAQEMASAVKWKIKDLVDSPLDQLAITLFPVPDDAYRGQNDMVYVVAARKSKIRQVVDMILKAGLKLEVIDIPELAMLNISRHYGDDRNGLAFIDLRSSGSTLNLCRDGQIYLTRHLNTRVDQDIINSDEWESVRDRLVLEIQRSLDYYESQMGQSPISRILLAPRESDTAQLVNQLNESMAVQVSALDLAAELDSAVELTASLQQACFMAIGGALRHEKPVARNKDQVAA